MANPNEAPAASRRSFLGGAGTVLALAASGVIGRAIVPSSAAAASSPRPTSTTALLALDGQMVGELASVSGGHPIVQYRPFSQEEPIQIGGVTYDALRITFSPGVAPGVSAWLNDTLAGKGAPKSGSVIHVDPSGREVRRLDFIDAVISEVALSPWDMAAVSRTAVFVTMTVLPASTSRSSGGGMVPRPPMPKRLQISGLGITVDGIDQNTFAQAFRVDGLAAKIAWKGDPADRQSLHSRVDPPKVVVSIAESGATEIYRWMDDVLAQRNLQPRNAQLALLSPTGPPLVSVGLTNVALVSVASVIVTGPDQIARCDATLQCDAMAMNLT